MQKDLLSITNLSKTEIENLIEMAATLKKGNVSETWAGKHVALIFEKPSLRTKASFEIAISELGGSTSFFGAAECGKMGERESIADFARVLSGYYDAVVARVFDHAQLVDFASSATVPVINALSDSEHPCQILADLLTIKERLGKLSGFKLAYLGDGNNVARSLAIASTILNFGFALAGPKEFWLPDVEGGQTEDLAAALKDADVIYTDTWVSMGEKGKGTAAFEKYQLNTEALKLAKPGAIVLHCLPAHRGQEITDEVADGPQSAIFQQAANRLPTAKAVFMEIARRAGLRKLGSNF
jgi:ornithine carbamoyltransferase